MLRMLRMMLGMMLGMRRMVLRVLRRIMELSLHIPFFMLSMCRQSNPIIRFMTLIHSEKGLMSLFG